MVLVILCSIGSVGPAAQRVVLGADAVAIPAATKALDLELLAAFDPPDASRWHGGFELAWRLGETAVPALRNLQKRESADYRVRLLLTTALALASGPASDHEVLGAALRGAATDRERFLIPLIAACRPWRGSTSAELEAWLRRGDLSPLLEGVALLALRVHPGASPSRRAYESDEPLIAAAARLAQPLAVDPAIARWREGRAPHAQLVLRAEQLAAPPTSFDRATALRLAAILADASPAARPLRFAAAAWLARVPDPRDWAAALTIPHEPELLAFLAASPAWRETDVLRGGLAPPSDSVDPAYRGAVVLAFALTAAPADFARVRSRWSRDGDDAAILALGVAWRLARSGTRELPPWIDELPDHPARDWVRIAVGRPPLQRERSSGDALLDGLFATHGDAELAAFGPELVAATTEDALRRLGAHLGALRRGLELDLVRDLCVAGSHHAAAVLGLPADPRQRYLARGIAAGDETFEIAFEFLRFTRGRAPTRRETDPLR
jgi:hypothetical protein